MTNIQIYSLSAVIAVAINLVELYVAPAILSAVERRVSVGELAATILGFVAALMLFRGIEAYLDENQWLRRLFFAISIYGQIGHKMTTTSYPNLSDGSMAGMRAKIENSTAGDSNVLFGVWSAISVFLKNLLGFILYIVVLSNVQMWLLAVIGITGAISYAVASYCNSYRFQHREEEAHEVKKLRYLYRVSMDRVVAKDIHIFGLRDWLEELSHKTMKCYEAFHEKVHKRLFWISITDIILTFLRNGLAYIYLIYLVLEGQLNAAEFVLYFSAVTGFATWMTGILNSLNVLIRYSNELTYVRELLDYPEVFRFEDGEALVHTPGQQYELRLDHVSYRYPGMEQYVLQNINLTLKPGEKLAVVGLNGAGKTTLVKILCGFLDPVEGRVLLNGQDIKKYNRRDYYKLFSAVFQQFMMMPNTIAANVAQSEENIDMERVRDCVEKAGLKEKVESQPKGYQTLLNRDVCEDAIALSGGESQKLMLARALYKDAPFVVLDEPTAALDPIAEADIYSKYHAMTQGKSSVYISHRLASTRFCDRILLIENAQIVEEGTHEALLALGGRYAELFEIQSKYYREGGENSEEG